MIDVKLNIEGQVGSGKTLINSIITKALEEKQLKITEREQNSKCESLVIKGEPIFKQELKKPILAVIDDEIALEALNNNILILEDPFRTGFECKACDGEGHTQELCGSCGGNKVVAHNPEFSAPAATLTEEELSHLPPHFAQSLRNKRSEQESHQIVSGGLMPCTKCQVSDKRGGTIISGYQQCPLCKGFGASMIVPEDAMRRPTSGKVVSLGPLCKFLKAGDHVVYSNMMGHATKFKQKDILRVMREDEIMMRIHGTKPENFQRKVTS